MNDRKKESLVLFSGGIDSTAALLWMLDNTDDNIEVHHIILKDRSNRWEWELEACDKIFKWMTKNKRSFEYTESIIDLGIEGGVLDMYIYMWLAGLKSQEKRGMLDRIVTGRLKPFNNKISQRRKNRTERVEKMLEILVSHSFDEEEKVPRPMESPNQTIQPEAFKPLLEMTKKEVIDSLPEELLKMCYYCRVPTLITEDDKRYQLRFLEQDDFSIHDEYIDGKKVKEIVNCDECHSCWAVRRSLGLMDEEEIKMKKYRMMD